MAWPVVLTLLVSGCVPHVEEVPIRDAPRPAAPSYTSEERRESPPDVSVTLVGNAVAVAVLERLECRSTTTTPMESDHGVTRTLSHGTRAQGFNLVVAAALLGVGIANYATASPGASCDSGALDPYAAPSPSCAAAQEQTQAQARQRQDVGIVIASLAAVPVGLLIWNVFRARDVRETVPAAPEEETSDWKTCATKPMPDIRVTLAASGLTLTGQTAADGTATLDLTPIASATDDPRSANVQVLLPGRPSTSSLDLTGSPAHAAWRQAHAAASAPASTPVEETP